LRSGGPCVRVLDKRLTRQVAQHECTPARILRSHNDDVSRADSIDRCYSNLVEVGAQLAKEEFAPAEAELVAFKSISDIPFGQCDAAFRHVLKREIGRGRCDLTRLHTSSRMLCNVAEAANLPTFGKLSNFGRDQSCGERAGDFAR